MKKEKIIVKIFLILLVASNIYGANIPNIGDVLKEVNPPKIEKREVKYLQ